MGGENEREVGDPAYAQTVCTHVWGAPNETVAHDPDFPDWRSSSTSLGSHPPPSGRISPARRMPRECHAEIICAALETGSAAFVPHDFFGPITAFIFVRQKWCLVDAQ